MEKKDIFDRIMELPMLSTFQKSYKKHKEVLLYLFFGGLTTLISILIFGGLIAGFQMDPLIANIISWTVSVAFAFITNSIWVFDGLAINVVQFLKRMINFYLGRVLTLFLEEGILFIFITKLECSSIIVKIVSQMLVIMLNYIISKLWIFKK